MKNNSNLKKGSGWEKGISISSIVHQASQEIMEIITETMGH